MIGKLRGVVDELEEDAVILDVGGVGYQVFVSARLLTSLTPGTTTTLSIEMHVREDHIHLFGFPTALEREWFRLLTTVQRLGNKMALAILGAYAPPALAHAILAKDVAAFSRISGVGAKLAERIVTELKDKVMKMPTSTFDAPHAGTAPTPESTSKTSKKSSKASSTSSSAAPAAAVPNHVDDAISALVNLGYSRSEAYSACLKAAQNAGTAPSLDTLVKLSLKELLRG